MAGLYTPQSLGITAPSGGFQNGSWYNARQYFNGTVSDVNTIHPNSSQPGAGNAVSTEVNNQSAAKQKVTPTQFNSYLNTQNNNSPAPSNGTPSGGAPSSSPSSTGSAGGTGVGITGLAAPSLDLTGMYQTLMSSPELKNAQAQLDSTNQEYNDKLTAKNTAEAQINDNPFYSEGTRVGRVAKLNDAFNNDVKSITDRQKQISDNIATQKADAETKINLATKQFDINSQSAQQSLSQFNTLLGMGALDNASGEDIANITRSTGLSSSMIQNAISSSKAKNVPTSTISYDDGTNQGFAIINSKTGDIISRQNVAASKPKSTSSTVNDKQQAKDNLTGINTDYSTYLNNGTVTVNGRTGPAQAVMSPDDFYKIMVQNYPSDISNIPKPSDIRKITGQQ